MTIKHLILASSLALGGAAWANTLDDLKAEKNKATDEGKRASDEANQLEDRGKNLEKRGDELKAKGKRLQKSNFRTGIPGAYRPHGRGHNRSVPERRSHQ